MRAVSRFSAILLAGALAFAPSAALAQQAPPASNSSAPDAVGPRELQNFSLTGTVTRSSDQPATVPGVQPTRRQRSAVQSSAAPAADLASAPPARESAPAAAPAPARVETASSSSPKQVQAQPQRAPEPAQSSTLSPPADTVPSVAASDAPAAAPQPSPAVAFAPLPSPAASLSPEHHLLLLPWVLAALALALGGAFLVFRSRGREALAGGPRIDAFIAPTPPSPRPRSPAPPPAAPKAAPAPGLGIVSTRLRPWIDIGFHPLRCVVDDDKVTVDFELELFNSGSAPARAVLAEASLFNAGPAQDQQIGAFFTKPVGQGERIVAIPPLQRVAMRTQVFAPREQVQAYQLAGRPVFVPLIAFNALYKWSGGEGQTSTTYLLGRDTKSEKLGPFRLDLGPHIFRGVAARLLPAGVRQ